MEVYNNRIAISYSELTSGDRPILSDAYWKQLKYRKQVMVVRRGCRGVEALIDYESSPAWLKKAYTDKYGSPELKKDDSLRKLIRKDEKAEQFYMRYAPTGKDYATLGAPYIYQYTQDASVLNAVIELERSMKATIGRTGGSTAHVWKNISTLVNNLQSEFGCKLPNNAMALKRKVAEYQISGYASLVSNRFGNKSASKTKKAEQEALMVELLGNGRNIDNAMISRLYNKVGERCGWPRISERTVANYKQKHPESYAGRHGASAYYNNKAMQVKRTRPSTPMLMWCADGWDTELLYQEASRDRQGRSVTTYHKRPTVVAVIDTYIRALYASGRVDDYDLNWSDKVANAVYGGKTLIAGGYINTQLLDVDTIFANKAYLGKFTLQDGWFTCYSADEGVGYINMEGTNTKVAFGKNLFPHETTPNMTCTAVITNNSIPSVDTGVLVNVGLQVTAKEVNNELWDKVVHSVAIDCNGGLSVGGGLSLFEDIYLNAFTNANSAEELKYKNTFVFFPYVSKNAYLPTLDAMKAAFPNAFTNGLFKWEFGFMRIRILVARWATSFVRVTQGNADTPLINGSATPKVYIDLYAGDYLELGFWHNAWYILNHRN